MKHRSFVVAIAASLLVLVGLSSCMPPALDLPAPSAPVLSAPTVTNERRPTWTWTASEYADDYLVQFSSMPGTWTRVGVLPRAWTPADDLTDGNHSLFVKAVNAEGEESSFDVRTVKVDTLAPAAPGVTLTSPATDRTPTWTWTASTDSVSFRVQLDATDADGWTSTAAKTWTAPALSVGSTHTLYVQGADAAGNWSLSGSASVTIEAGGEAVFTENMSLPLAVRDYYRSAYGLSGAELKAELRTILSSTHAVKTYTGLWTMYQTTDVAPNGSVWDMYSSTSADGTTAAYWFTFVEDQDTGSGGGTEGEFFNREHTWPNSTFSGESNAAAYADGHSITPTDKNVNNTRSDYSYGEVGTTSWTSLNGSKLGIARSGLGFSGTVFEPLSFYKGDFARMHFYQAVRYYGDTKFLACDWANPGAKLKTWYDDMLRVWAAADPVSVKETARNGAVAAWQGNRNPFIDYPELVDLVDFEN